jgi:carboxymethylenebutenolidase
MLLRRVLQALALACVMSSGIAAQAAPYNKQRVTFKSGDLTLVGYVYHPDGAGPFPTVIWNHGSEPNPGSRQFDAVANIFVPAGYAVFAPVRRGQGGSGGTYIVDVVDRLRARRDGSALSTTVRLLETEQLDDQLAGLAYAKSQPFVDQGRLVVAGCSYGGIQTLLAAERNVGFRAAMPISPAAQSWEGNPLLRDRMKRAVRAIDIPVLLIAPPRDASLAPPRELGDEAKRAHKASFTTKIYPPTMPDSEQTHCFGGAPGFHNWATDAVTFFNSALAVQK